MYVNTRRSDTVKTPRMAGQEKMEAIAVMEGLLF